MWIDQGTLFSDKQAITTSANSTNTIDLGPAISSKTHRDDFRGSSQTQIKHNAQAFAAPALRIFCQVNEDFTGGSAVVVYVQDSADDSTFATVRISGTLENADLKKGNVILDDVPVRGLRRYVRLYYLVTGTYTAGKLTSGINVGGTGTGNAISLD